MNPLKAVIAAAKQMPSKVIRARTTNLWPVVKVLLQKGYRYNEIVVFCKKNSINISPSGVSLMARRHGIHKHRPYKKSKNTIKFVKADHTESNDAKVAKATNT